jgi:threonine synthase
VDSVSDDEIKARIKADAQSLNQVWCPHTAVAAEVYQRIAQGIDKARANEHWVIVSTAHPAKFNDIVEPLIGREVPVPPALAKLLSLPRHESELAPTLDALRSALQGA